MERKLKENCVLKVIKYVNLALVGRLICILWLTGFVCNQFINIHIKGLFIPDLFYKSSYRINFSGNQLFINFCEKNQKLYEKHRELKFMAFNVLYDQ